MANIGEVAMDAILSGAEDEEALAAVLKAFPEASTKLASIKWYRSKLRREVKEGSRDAGKEGASQRRHGGLIPDKEMSDETKEFLAENRVIERDSLHAKRMADQEVRLAAMSYEMGWKKRFLSRYVGNVLLLSGEKRLAFFVDNPVSDIFK